METILSVVFAVILSLTLVGCTVFVPPTELPDYAYTQPSSWIVYEPDGQLAIIAALIANECDSEIAKTYAISGWVLANIHYDNAKRDRLRGSRVYVVDPEQVLRDGSGICWDRACLTAAMLRSVGIPSYVQTGYIFESTDYHAWTMAYFNGKWHDVNTGGTIRERRMYYE